jgi:PAS domain S-box-containing protein
VEIVLAPLSLNDVGRLIGDALRCGERQALSLAGLVYEKTGGNPFFAIQFITELVEERLISLDADQAVWVWDEARIRAKGYTDNVINLMAARISRLPKPALELLKQFACLGNMVEFETLASLEAHQTNEIHPALFEAVRLGLVIRLDNAYRFLHDRIQEATYSLIPDDERANSHLRIGRLLISRRRDVEIEGAIFDIVGQFNRATSLITDPAERVAVAKFNLTAGMRAQAATAYASAIARLNAGYDLLPADCWQQHYPLSFALKFHLAECEFLNLNFDLAESQIASLLEKARSKVDRAAAFKLKIDLHVLRSEHTQAISAAVECLELFGIRLSPHPHRQDVDWACNEILSRINGRSIGSLVDLPRLSDQEIEAAMGILATMYAPAMFTDAVLTSLHICHMVLLTLDHGLSDASVHGFGCFGIVLGNDYGRYEEGYQFVRLARDVVGKHRLVASEAKMLWAYEIVSLWVRPPSVAIEAIRTAFRAGVEAGDLMMACYACNHLITDLLLRGDHLDEVWEETERCFEFAHKANFRDVRDVIIGQQRFIQKMRGLTQGPLTFDGNGFVEEQYETSLTPDRATTMVCWYWIIKAQARFIFGDIEEARRALARAELYLWSSPGHIQLLDYHFYSALVAAADINPDLAIVAARRDQLYRWSQSCPSTFADKHALICAEIARLEKNDQEAIRHYADAIRLAGENKFVHIEAIAHEAAARYYAQRGDDASAQDHLQNACRCYLRWGAIGKVQQLEGKLSVIHGRSQPTASALVASMTQMDIAAVLKASQAVSSEIIPDKLIEALMTLALEHAGAERGVLVTLKDDALVAEAVAETSKTSVNVVLGPDIIISKLIPVSLVITVARTRERVILDDARKPSPFVQDDYVVQRRPRSILCLPLLKQGKLIAVMYLENSLTSATFAPRRISVLELLATQAAISLENARLYADLIGENRERQKVEASLAEAQRISHTGSWRWNVATGAVQCSDEQLRIFGLDPTASCPSHSDFLKRVYPEDRSIVKEVFADAVRGRHVIRLDFRIVVNGQIKHVLGVGGPDADESSELFFFGTIMDVTERRQAEEALRHSQAELARNMRLSTIGELTASIVHEVNQPLTAIITNAEASLRWLDRKQPDLDKVHQAIVRLAQDAKRAGEVISGLRALARKSKPDLAVVDLNEVIWEVLRLVRDEIGRGAVNLDVNLSDAVGLVSADKVQLQQVLLNLIRNGIESMAQNHNTDRVLQVVTDRVSVGEAMVTVADTGVGLSADILERIYEPLFTTKRDGMGMGLSICRSIVEAHRGKLWASPNGLQGTKFQFSLPLATAVTVDC